MGGFIRTSLLTVLSGRRKVFFPFCPVQLLACVVKENWKDLVCACSLKNWREALALLLTYSGPEKFPELCGRCDSSTCQQIYAKGRHRVSQPGLWKEGLTQEPGIAASCFPEVSYMFCLIYLSHGKFFDCLYRARLTQVSSFLEDFSFIFIYVL